MQIPQQGYGYRYAEYVDGKVKKVNGMTNIRYLLFSISGFSEDLRDFAEDNGVTLVDLKKLYD